MAAILRSVFVVVPARSQVCGFAVAHHVVHAHEFDPRGGNRPANGDGIADGELGSIGHVERFCAGGNVGVGNARLRRVGFRWIAVSAAGAAKGDRQMGPADEFDRGAMRIVGAAATAAQHDAAFAKIDRACTTERARLEQHRAAETIDERQRGHFVDGGLNDGRRIVIGFLRRRRFDGALHRHTG